MKSSSEKNSNSNNNSNLRSDHEFADNFNNTVNGTTKGNQISNRVDVSNSSANSPNRINGDDVDELLNGGDLERGEEEYEEQRESKAAVSNEFEGEEEEEDESPKVDFVSNRYKDILNNSDNLDDEDGDGNLADNTAIYEEDFD